MAKTITLKPQKERVSFAKFIKLVKEHRADLRSVAIDLPQLGTPGFGSVVVEYRTWGLPMDEKPRRARRG